MTDNPYAQFGFSGDQDAAAPAPSGSPDVSGPNPYAQFGPSPTEQAAAADDDGKASLTSVAKNFGTGMLAGIPNLATTVEHALTPPDLISGAKNWWDVVSDPDAWKFSGPASPELQAKIGQANADRNASLGPGIGETIKRGMGELGFDPDNPEQLPQPQNAPERIARTGGEGLSSAVVFPGSPLVNATVGTASGIGSGIGREVAPDKYKDLGGLLGGLVGGGVGAVASEVPSAIGAGARSAADYAAPFTTGGQERLAAKTIANAASDRDAALQALSQPQEIVPGSMPTTFQATGDTGLGQLERAVATKSPDEFLTRRADQNAARLDALSDIQAEGHPEAVGSFFRDQLDQIDQQMQAAQDAAATSARSATEGLGGAQPTDVLGENLRTPVQNSVDAAKASERALWKAVDPDETLQTVAAPIKTAYADVYGNLGPEGSIGLTPVEKQLGDVIQGYGDALPLQRAVALRSVISKAMRDANSPLQANSIAYGRLSQLRGAVEDAISQSVSQKAADEQLAVQTGAMQPEDMMLERLRQEVSDFQSAKRAQLVGTAGGDAGGALARGPRVFPRQMGAGNEAGRPAVGAESGSQPQATFLDQGAADRLKQATAATAQRKQTFGTKPVSQILQRPGSTQPYNMPGGAVSSSAWKAGAGGGDAVNAILKASPQAVGPLKEIAAASLRSKAADGIITGKTLEAWKAQHGPALKALEQASPGSTAAFENAARAGDHLATLAQQRKDALTAVEPGEACSNAFS
ncbi:hypothetical protein EOA79_02205, partial [Mesorhizobium sp. M1A.F.Ca.IN.020.03.2.1]|uniref:hypothetical protein n=1 Tax=Mesorhizobium sp. M1A.F.Ca.IN.020.03.2.1 TaxID=2496769 RepID=UPI000FD5E373